MSSVVLSDMTFIAVQQKFVCKRTKVEICAVSVFQKRFYIKLVSIMGSEVSGINWGCSPNTSSPTTSIEPRPVKIYIHSSIDIIIVSV